jgi:hypothetical protein
MKVLLWLLIVFVFPATSFSQHEQSLATVETMASTFNLYGDKATGTCFMVIKGEKQYFVTAAHLFASSRKSGDAVPIKMLIHNQLQAFDAKVYFHPNRDVDIALIKLSGDIIQNLELSEEFTQPNKPLVKAFKSTGISLDSLFLIPGMEVLFYGFPLGNLGTEALGIKFPLVKKAIVSGWVRHKALDKLVLDGHNNLGFSGGPVVAYDTSRKKMFIVGVISGYIPEPVYVQYKKNTLSIQENSGIIICYGRHYIEEIFTMNKISLP